MSTNRPLQVVNSSDRSTDLSGIFAEYILGKRFFSWDEFEKSLAEFQKLSYTHYVHNCSKTIPDARFKYAYVGFKCTFGVNRTRPGLKLKNKSSKCCNCSSSFRVVLHYSEYIIASHNMVHNHPCSRVYMQNDPWYRRLTVEEKENIEPLLQQSHSSDEIIMHVKEKYNKDITRIDVKNMKAAVNKGISSRRDIFEFLKSRGKLMEYYSDEPIRNSLTRICFATYEQMELYKQFPEVVGIDSTYNTNKGKYSLFQLLVTDNFGRGRPVLFAWTRKEFKRDVVWILDCFRQIMEDTSKTESFIMDCAQAEIAAVKLTHRQAHIVLCSFHVCRAFCRKTRNPIVKNYLCRLVQCKRRSEVISRLDANVSQYLQRRWMHRRELWAACFRDNVLTFGNDTNNRVESSHKQMKRFLQRSDSLHKSMLKVYKWHKRSFSIIQQEANIAQSRCFTYPCSQSLIPIIRLLTPYAARKVIREYQLRRWATVEFESFDYVFFKENGNTVQVDLSACTCTCFTFQTCRYPCRHLLLVHFRKPYFTVNHVMHNCKQWTWSRNLFASQSTSAVIPRNRSDIYDTKKKIINAGMDRINDKFGEVFANAYADGVIAGINRVLNM
uniref:SWIM-type domain-containing protein n=2 Tax=Trichobilharzia regenti TaxID=157069 RepID=A0AA85KKE7_TRIRE|nr:unnamed protein product [Trichobilharzia regenti]